MKKTTFNAFGLEKNQLCKKSKEQTFLTSNKKRR